MDFSEYENIEIFIKTQSFTQINLPAGNCAENTSLISVCFLLSGT